MEVKAFDNKAGLYHFVESELSTGFHAHPAIEIIIARQNSFSVHTPTASYLQVKAAIVKPNRKHALDGSQAICEIILLETGWTSFNAYLQATGIPDTNESILLINEEIFPNFHEKIMQTLPLPYPSFDGRVIRCIENIHATLPEGKLSLPELAAHMHISPSRLSHLFKQQTGIALQKYIIWARLKQAIYIALQNGIDLTDAAFAAGFYDSAHFSRKFKDFFGIKPSLVYNSRIVQVL